MRNDYILNGAEQIAKYKAAIGDACLDCSLFDELNAFYLIPSRL